MWLSAEAAFAAVCAEHAEQNAEDPGAADEPGIEPTPGRCRPWADCVKGRLHPYQSPAIGDEVRFPPMPCRTASAIRPRLAR
jgi:hypothetical protein